MMTRRLTTYSRMLIFNFICFPALFFYPYGTSTLPFPSLPFPLISFLAAVAGVFTYTKGTVEEIRGGEDVTSSLVAGFVAGSLAGFPTKSILVGDNSVTPPLRICSRGTTDGGCSPPLLRRRRSTPPASSPVGSLAAFVLC